ncbi:MAG: putative toxin-antitoxin system toxin component, PIN family [Gammaproteobacteria bacterium]
MPANAPPAILPSCDVRDDKFLELAVAGQAMCIITGDSDLLDLHPFRGIPIVTPAQFIGPVAGA